RHGLAVFRAAGPPLYGGAAAGPQPHGAARHAPRSDAGLRRGHFVPPVDALEQGRRQRLLLSRTADEPDQCAQHGSAGGGNRPLRPRAGRNLGRDEPAVSDSRRIKRLIIFLSPGHTESGRRWPDADGPGKRGSGPVRSASFMTAFLQTFGSNVLQSVSSERRAGSFRLTT